MAANLLGIEVDSNSDNCMICLESLSSEQQYTLPECSHTFHQNCIMHWFRSGSHKCPLCNNLGINDNSNSNTHNNSSTRWGWWRGGQQRYQMIRKYSRKKDAPQMLKKEVEISSIIPAPSPVFPSASTAPRCQTAFSASIPNSTIFLDFVPFVEATRPTPHASCSRLG